MQHHQQHLPSTSGRPSAAQPHALPRGGGRTLRRRRHNNNSLNTLVVPSAKARKQTADVLEREGAAPTAPPQRQSRKPKAGEFLDESPEVLERGAPSLPKPGMYQQTLLTAFTLGGMGLHSAEYMTVTVKPACANEGRYFVRVPEGTNRDKFQMDEGAKVRLHEGGEMASDPELDRNKMELFKMFLVAEEEEGFVGTFQEFLLAIDRDDILEGVEKDPNFRDKLWAQAEEADEIFPRGSDEVVLQAHIDQVPNSVQAVALNMGAELGQPGSLLGPELLLAALECCGVDNARIEVEGGRELPVLDGSALGWAMEVQFAGLRLAPEAGALVAAKAAAAQRPEEAAAIMQTKPVTKMVARTEEMLTVREDDSFIMLMPEDTMRQTVGIDCTHNAPVIGKQWLSWSMFEDPHFRIDLAGARRYLESPDEVLTLHKMGWLQGGTEAVQMVGFGDRWYDSTLVRMRDEPVRHEMVCLLGILSLLARPGHAGIPVGHIVQYKATLELQLKFARELRTRLKEEEFIPVSYTAEVPAPPPSGPEKEGEGEGEGKKK